MSSWLARVPLLGRLPVNDRATEAIVGLLVALGARGSARISSAEADPLQLAAISLGATVLWGLIDGFLKLLANKGARLRWAHLTGVARDPARRGHGWAEEALDMSFLAHLDGEARRRIRGQVVEEAAASPAANPRLTRDDWLDALAVLVVVVLAGIPPVLPLLLVGDLDAASYASYGVAVAMLAAFGLGWGPEHGLPPHKAAAALGALGVVLVAAVLLLGG